MTLRACVSCWWDWAMWRCSVSATRAAGRWGCMCVAGRRGRRVGAVGGRCGPTVSGRWCWWTSRRSVGQRGWCGTSAGGAARGGAVGRATVTEAAREIAPPRALLTSRAARWATRQAGRGRPLKDAAAELGCGWHAVNLAVQRWGRALLDADTGRISEVAALGLDEHLMMRRGRFRAKTWGTSIVDVGRGQLLDIVRARDAKAPTRWLLRRPREWREAIRWAVPGPLGPLPRRVQRRGAQSPTGC